MRIRPAAPASRPWRSACFPSVAETCVFEISFSETGRAPIRRLFARSCVCVIEPIPLISAPVSPEMPSGFST